MKGWQRPYHGRHIQRRQFPLQLRQPVVTQVRRDAIKPGAKARRALKAWQSLPGAHKSLLGHVLRFLMIVQGAQSQIVDQLCVHHDQCLKSGRVAPLRPFDKRRFILTHKIHFLLTGLDPAAREKFHQFVNQYAPLCQPARKWGKRGALETW
jgi:hypothetical protein